MRRTLFWISACLEAIYCMATSPLASAMTAPAAPAPAAHLRFNNERIAEVVGFAMDRSLSFRQLVVTVEASDDIVYVDEGRCQAATVRSCVRLLPQSGVRRMLILVQPRQPIMAVVAQLAHELQHAVEIVREPAVVDANALTRLYERTGFRTCEVPLTTCWETWAAQDVETAVLRETSSNRPIPARTTALAFFGTWRLNADLSSFDNTVALRSGTRVNGDRGYGLISIVLDTETADGGRNRATFVYRPDGREYTIGCSERPCPSITIMPVDSFAVDFVVKQAGAVLSTGRQTLARDGSLLVVSSHGTDAAGHPTSSIVVWEKQE